MKRILLCGLATIRLYVLSIGPAVRWLPESWDDALFKAYAPVIWLHGHTILKGPLEGYVGLWHR